MPTRSIVLTEEQDRLVEALVRSGRYGDVGEVVDEGLRLVEEQNVGDAQGGWTLDELRAAAQVGVEAIERGEYIEFADASELAAYLETLADEVLSGKDVQ